jgi:hypothetical protein
MRIFVLMIIIMRKRKGRKNTERGKTDITKVKVGH